MKCLSRRDNRRGVDEHEGANMEYCGSFLWLENLMSFLIVCPQEGERPNKDCRKNA